MRGNTKTGGYSDFVPPAERLAQFDKLPRRIKLLYWRAPHDFAVKQAFDILHAHRNDVEATRAYLLAAMINVCARDCARDYGPDHPQATVAGWQPRHKAADA